tara:strand:+ start:28 stop:645 length:618 start_codon:yes stop_codon:yes gene_type:complete
MADLIIDGTSVISKTGSTVSIANDVAFPTGHIIKITSTTLTTSHTYTVGGSNPDWAWKDTDLYHHITPTYSSSNILLQIHVSFSSTNDAYARLVRYTNSQFTSGHTPDGINNGTSCTPIAVSTETSSSYVNTTGTGTFKYYVPSNQYKCDMLSFTHLDSPNTTEKTYYGFQGMVRGSGQTFRINTAANDYATRAVSSLTLYEVAG